MEKVVIVTGGSKGIGNGLLEAYRKQNYRLFSISRTRNKQHDEGVEYLKLDLSNGKRTATVLAQIFQLIDEKSIERIVLINNAATLGTVDKVDNIPYKDIQKTINLNLIAPFILTSSFIKLTANWTCSKKIINISSGAANKPNYGWAVYSSTKAALDMMTRAVATEQEYQKHGVKIIAIHPGIIDTKMQAKIRKVDESKFKDVKRFIAFKKEGKLADPAVVGARIYEVDNDEAIENGAIIKL